MGAAEIVDGGVNGPQGMALRGGSVLPFPRQFAELLVDCLV